MALALLCVLTYRPGEDDDVFKGKPQLTDCVSDHHVYGIQLLGRERQALRVGWTQTGGQTRGLITL